MIKKGTYFGAILMLFSYDVFAGDELYDQTITDIIINLSSGVHFRTNEPMVNPSTCSSGLWYKLPSDSNYEKEAYSLLLSKQARKEKVTIYLDGCTGSYPKVVWVY